MDCEMCGTTEASNTAMVEGVQMTVCDRCASHGTVLRRAPAQTFKPRKQQRAFAPAIEEDEIIEDVRPDVSTMLKNYRERTGLSLHEFAAKINTKASVYQHFESGSRKPSIETAHQLERIIGEKLVVKMKIKKGSFTSEDGPGLTLGDFLKPKRR